MISSTRIISLTLALLFALPTTALATGNTPLSPIPELSGNGMDDDGIQGPVSLRNAVTVIDDVVKLGDIFTNMGGLSDRAIAYAPHPGHQAIYGAKWLSRVARYYNFDWQPVTLRDQVVVQRDSTIIENQEIIDAIMLVLEDQGVSPDMQAELANRTFRIELPVDAIPEISIDNISYDQATQRFSAIVSAPAGDPAAKQYRLNGSLYRVMEVPILVNPVKPGDIITENDVTLRKIHASKVSRDTLTSLDDVIGKSLRRSVRIGHALRTTEVQAPVLVKKKSLVVLILENPNMTITAQGRAIDQGSMGDIIRISNTQSNTIVEAEIIAPGRAIVHTPSIVALNN